MFRSGNTGKGMGSPARNRPGARKRVLTAKRYSVGKGSRPRPPPPYLPPPPRFGLDDQVDAATQRGNIKVVVRVRPPNNNEIGPCQRLVVQAVDAHMVVFDPIEDNNEFYFHGIKQKSRDFLKKPNKDKKFVFDNVYGPHSTNEEIFQEAIMPTIDTIIAGFNCSVFAYGSTGSGKTYTMVGQKDSDQKGLTYLTVMELYKRLKDMEHEYESEIMISYLEVYNELVKDLLVDDPENLNLLEDTKGVVIPKLSQHKPETSDHIFRLLQEGNSRRTQHPTDHNQESSRSHAVFQVIVTLRGRYTNLTNTYKAAKLVMVDLAGSERGAATGFQGARFREGASINKSLLALGNCINALAEGKRHVPYRDSKLTRILKDSLGGNCKTVMIANVSPSDRSYEDSFNTLRYADRAKRIKFNVKKNTLTFSARAAQYVKVVEEMSTQLNYYKNLVEEYERNCRCKVSKTDAATEMDEEMLGNTNQATPPETPISISNATFVQAKPTEIPHTPPRLRYVIETCSLRPIPNFKCLEPVHHYSCMTNKTTPIKIPRITSTTVSQVESYDKFSRILDEKIRLESRANDLMTKLRDIDWKLKQKEARINCAKFLLTSETAKGMDRMNKQYDNLLKKKSNYDKSLRETHEELAVMKQVLFNAEKAFCETSKEIDMISVSRQEFVQLRKLQAEKSLQPSFQSHLQPSFNGMFEELIKTEEMLFRFLKGWKQSHLLMRHYGHATGEDEQNFSESIMDFFCSRIHFANNNETTLALSPYCDNINSTIALPPIPPSALTTANGNGNHTAHDESDVSSSTDHKY